MLTSIRRIIKSGWLGFWRNKWLSSAAVSTMSLAIIGITSLLLINVLVSSLTTSLEDKIDVSVYFHLDTSEDEILETRSELVKLNEVKSVEYVSSEEALKKFKTKHNDNQILMQSLNELGSNPLEASLNIKAQQASQYEAIVGFFDQGGYQEIVDKINYLENKTVYSSRKEIRVMKLVGASNWFTWGPFLVEGALYGVSAVVIALLVLYPLLWYVSPAITQYLPGTDLFYFFKANFLALFMIQLGIGVGLGAASSLIAVRRYSEV